jgi:hypothetical protein
MVSMPEPPNPQAVANAQAQSNQQTANYQQRLNMVDQTTPYGNIHYTQNGTWDDGTPRFSASMNLSPELQGLVSSNIGNAQGNSALEHSLLGNLQQRLSSPLSLGWSETESRLNELGRHTLDPQFKQGQDELEQRLYNQGLRPGSEAYDNAMRGFNNQRAAAYNDMFLRGHQTAVNDLMAEYNQPLNALTALRSNSQVSQPGVGQMQTPQTGVQGTNVAGIYQNAYQQQAQQAGAAMGGMFGLGGSLLGGIGQAGGVGAFFSDRRVKKNIRMIGRLDNGLPLYRFEYLWGGGERVGLMAQDVEKLRPWAVREIGGVKAVHYELAVT